MINNDELLFVVDENDQPLKPLQRSQVIKQGLWRRTGGGMVVDAANSRVLCQKRSDSKDERPGFWIADFGGKSLAGEQPEQTALRELKEELGIRVEPTRIHFFKKLPSIERRQIEYVFWVDWGGELSQVQFDINEVSEVAWHGIDSIRQFLTSKTPEWYSYDYELDLLDWIEKQP